MKYSQHTATLLFLTVATIGLSACGGGGGTSAEVEVSDVTVLSTTPATLNSDVARDPGIRVTFSGDVLAPSVDENSFQILRQTAEPVEGVISFIGSDEIGFSVDEDLDLLTNYNGKVSTDITDLSGRPLANDYVWPFVSRDGIWRERDSLGNPTSRDSVVAVDGNNNTWALYRRDNLFSGHNDIFARRLLSDNAWDSSRLVSNSTNGEGVISKPKVAVLSNGDLLLVWEEDSPGLIPAQLAYNRYSVATDSWGESQLINAGAFTHAYLQLSANNQGDVMAVFQMISLGPVNISALVYDSEADQWDDGIEIDDTAFDAYPRVAIDDLGNAMVIWVQSEGVYSRTYHFSTQTWGAIEIINNSGGILLSGLDLVSDSQGNFTAVWAQTSLFSIISFNRHSPENGWADATQIGGFSDFNPQLDLDLDDNLTLIWQQSTSGITSLTSSRWDALALDWSTPVFIEDNDDQPASQARLTVDNSGNVMAVWQQNREGTFFDLNGNIFIDPPSIWIRRYNNLIDEWNSPEAISGLGGDVAKPAIVNNASGEIMVLWEQDESGQNRIQSRLFD